MTGNPLEKLIHGGLPARLNLEYEGARLLVQGHKLEQVQPVETFKIGRHRLTWSSGTVEANGLKWEGLHFRKCRLSPTLFVACELSDCIFEDCDCRDIGFWQTSVQRCTFIRSNLKDAAFGGMISANPEPNVFRQVNFEECDLRNTAHSVERYESCSFRNCRLTRVDFHGAVFENCIFQGVLDDVSFRREDEEYPRLPKNHLSRCDFRDANVRTCAFLRIDLDPAQFASDSDLLVLRRGPKDWEEWLASFQLQPGSEGKRWFIDQKRKKAGTPSIVSRSYLLAVFTEEEVGALEKITARRM